MSYNKNTHKLISLGSFLILLIISFIIIGKVQTLANHAINVKPSMGLIIFLIAIIVVLGLLHVIQVSNLTKESIHKDEYAKKSYVADMDEYGNETRKATEESGKEQDFANIDIQAIEEKILPREENLSLEKYCENLLTRIAREYDIVQGLCYYREKDTDNFTIGNKYAYFGEEEPNDFQLGVTLSGQTAKNQKVLNLRKIPENYITILSGLGSSSPNAILLVPLLHENKTVGLLELATFKHFDKKTEHIFSKLSESIGSQISKKIT